MLKKDNSGLFRMREPSILQDNWIFEDGKIRNFLSKIYSEGKLYSLFNIISSGLAESKLVKYVGKHKWDSTGRVGISTFNKAGNNNSEETLHFNNNLKEIYLCSLDSLLSNFIGKNNFIRFNLVEVFAKGVSEPHQAVFWPEIYVLESKYSREFDVCLKSLNSDISYTFLKKYDSPQNYHTAEFDILREENVLPFTIKDKTIMSSRILKNAINFLIPFRANYRNEISSEDF